MRLLTASAIVLSFAATGTALADETRRFPQSKITPEEWQTFFDEVKAKPGAQDISRPERPDVVAIAVRSELNVYYFTKPGPVHPAVVVAHVIQDGTKVSLAYTGYYAGSEDAFAKWFKAFQR